MLKKILVIILSVLLLFLYACSTPERQPLPAKSESETSTDKVVEQVHPIHLYDNFKSHGVSIGSLNSFLRNNKIVGYIDYQEFFVLGAEKTSDVSFRYVAEENLYLPLSYGFTTDDDLGGYGIYIVKDQFDLVGPSSKTLQLTLEDAQQTDTFEKNLRASYFDVSSMEGIHWVYVQIGKAYYCFKNQGKAPNFICIPIDDVFFHIRFNSSAVLGGYNVPETEVMNNLMNIETAPAQIDELIAQWEGKWQSFNN